MVNSIQTSDFFMGATVLCWVRSSEQQAYTTSVLSEEKLREMNHLIVQAYHYCVQQQSRSREARKVAAALHMILTRLGLIDKEELQDTCSAPGLPAAFAIGSEENASSNSLPVIDDYIEPVLFDMSIDGLFGDQDIDWVSSTIPISCCS